jgi:hypothetical protein
MSFPFRSGWRPSTFNRLVELFRSTVEQFPDERTGDNGMLDYSSRIKLRGDFIDHPLRS